MFCDIHTHSNPHPDVAAVVDISGREDCFVFYDGSKHHFFSAGIHPKSIGEDWKNKLSGIEMLAGKNNFAGVGECGLDKFSDCPRGLQEEVFEAQLSLCQRIDKPIIIHCVRLYTDVVRLIKKVNFQNPAIFHGYNGNPDVTAQLLKLPNAFFSFSASTFATPETSGAKSLPLIPTTRILTETDCGENSNMPLTIKLLADKKNIEPHPMQQMIFENFWRVMS